MILKRKTICALGAALFAFGLIWSSDTFAQTPAPLRPPGGGTAVAQPPLLSGGASIDLAVPLYQSRVVTVITPANRVSVANPDVADIVVISPTELYVLGKDLGTTADWQAIKSDWSALKGKTLTLSPDDSAVQHNDLVRVGNTTLRFTVFDGPVPVET